MTILHEHHIAMGALCLSVCLTGCTNTPISYVQPPLNVPPNTVPNYIEKVNNGAIYQPGMMSTSLFSGERRPHNIGDTLKVKVAEMSSASRKLNTDTRRENKVAVKGPGTKEGDQGNLLDRVLNLDATASGSDSYKGAGSTDNSSSLTADITASVINVMPNGHLVIAGERGISLNGGISTLRISGIVNPKDIKAGNIVASADVLNARFEVSGEGDVAEAGGRNWLQRLLTKTLTVW